MAPGFVTVNVKNARTAERSRPPSPQASGPERLDPGGFGQRLQLAGWDVSRGALAKLESQLRRVPDGELLFLASVLGVGVADLFPEAVNLKKLGPQFRR